MGCVSGERERERQTYNWVLMFHTERPSSYSAKEGNRMWPLVPFVCLSVLTCVVRQVHACCTHAGHVCACTLPH